jgi:hypothetical protein
MTRLYFFVVLIVLCQACGSSQKTSSTDLPKIDFTNLHIAENPKDLFESSEIILLDASHPNALIQEISQMILAKDTIIIIDQKQQKIFTFDTLGNYITSFKHQGRGPGEYTTIDDVSYQDGLYILDLQSGNILQYNLNGDWMTSHAIDVPKTGYFFQMTPQHTLFFRNQEHRFQSGTGYNLVAYALDAKSIVDSNAFIDPVLREKDLFRVDALTNFQNEAYALLPFDTLLFKMDEKGQIAPYYRLHMAPENTLQKDEQLQDPNFKNFELHDYLRSSNLYYNLSNLQLSEKYIGFNYFFNMDYRLLLHDKVTQQSMAFNPLKLNPGKQGGVQLGAVQGDNFYFVLSNIIKSEIEHTTGMVLPDDHNPLLLKARLKKNFGQ